MHLAQPRRQLMPHSFALLQQELRLFRRSERLLKISKSHGRAECHRPVLFIDSLLYFFLQCREVVIPRFVPPSPLTDKRLVDVVRATTVWMPPIWQLANSDGLRHQINE